MPRHEHEWRGVDREWEASGQDTNAKASRITRRAGFVPEEPSGNRCGDDQGGTELTREPASRASVDSQRIEEVKDEEIVARMKNGAGPDIARFESYPSQRKAHGGYDEGEADETVNGVPIEATLHGQNQRVMPD